MYTLFCVDVFSSDLLRFYVFSTPCFDMFCANAFCDAVMCADVCFDLLYFSFCVDVCVQNLICYISHFVLMCSEFDLLYFSFCVDVFRV